MLRVTVFYGMLVAIAALGVCAYAGSVPTLREAIESSGFVAVAAFTGTYEGELAVFVIESVLKGHEGLTSVPVSVSAPAGNDGACATGGTDFTEGARYLFFGLLENNVLYINGGTENRWRVRRVYPLDGADTIDATVFLKGEGLMPVDIIREMCGEKKPEKPGG